MRHFTWIAPVLMSILLAGCSSDEPAAATATASAVAATATASATAGASYAVSARAVLVDLAAAQRGLADALAAEAPLSDAWKQRVAARIAELANLEERASKLEVPADQRAAHVQLTLAIRRTREAADTAATAVAEGNVTMLERANALLSDAAFQTTAAVAVHSR